jgi:lipopolysaccharide biosynthesis glycosyltransferase
MVFNVYIGYDAREDIAAEVCKFSIQKRLTTYANVRYLRSNNVLGYARVNGGPQSTDFTYTRFFIPSLEGYKGFSVFCDCDFLFIDDINELVASIDPTKAVSVVKHPRYIPNTDIKMDGISQHPMLRKNWASLMVFNNAHPSNAILTPDYVNTVEPGRSLHQFGWLKDEEIGSISLDWNTLDGYYELDNPRAIHYTDGGPWFDDYKQTHYSNYWWNEYDDYINTCGKQRTLSANT